MSLTLTPLVPGTWRGTARGDVCGMVWHGMAWYGMAYIGTREIRCTFTFTYTHKRERCSVNSQGHFLSLIDCLFDMYHYLKNPP
jgi:hypothetical protein